jgi:hypothetical protein
MKIVTGVYVFFLVIGIVSSLLILGIYYTQDFTKDINFVDSINYDEIEIETYESDVVYLQSAKAKIGSVILDNDGIFESVYSFPEFIGCINYADNNGYDSFIVRFQVQDSNEGYPLVNLNRESRVRVDVGDKKVFDIYAYYTGYNSKRLDDFSRENIKSVSIYKTGNREENPFDFNDGYGYYYYKEDCSSLSLNDEPEKIILII